MNEIRPDAAPASQTAAGAAPLRGPGSLQLWIIGNAIIAALIDRQANIVWHCVPRLDGDPVFCRLLEPHHADDGVMSVELRGCHGSEQHYIDNTEIGRASWRGGEGDTVEKAASRRRHTRFSRDWSSDVCSSDLSAMPSSPR